MNAAAAKIAAQIAHYTVADLNTRLANVTRMQAFFANLPATASTRKSLRNLRNERTAG